LNLPLPLIKSPKVATTPPELRGIARDQVKLMVLDRVSGTTRHTQFFHLPDYLSPGDLVVVNRSAAIPGQLRAKFHGTELLLHLATKLSNVEYIVERRTADGSPYPSSFRHSDLIEIWDPNFEKKITNIRVLCKFHERSRLWVIDSPIDLFHIAKQIGSPIRYGYIVGNYDPTLYRTIFAHCEGSAEMPSASRPFTHDVVKRLVAKGVQIRSLILHTGVSSHEVKTDLSDHPVLPEWYNIPENTSMAVKAAVAAGRRVIAVGTTVVRALESALDPATGFVQTGSRWTTHLVTPSTPPRVTSGLVTGMHDSMTSHLALLYAFVEPKLLHVAYREAVDNDYLWHEFGDVNLIL